MHVDPDEAWRRRESFDGPSRLGPRLKLKRAIELQNALVLEIDQFRMTAPLVTPRFTEPETDSEGNKWDVVYCESVGAVPVRFSLLAGDIVHNLRSALDHLIYQLVLLDQNEPTKQTAFPIFTKEPTGNSLRIYNKKLEGIENQEVLRLVEESQPFFKQPPTEVHEDLALLNDLDVIDKHHLIRPGLAVLMDVLASPGALPMQGRIEVDKELFRRPFNPAEITFGINSEFVFWEQEVSMERLGRLTQTVDVVLTCFYPFFFSET